METNSLFNKASLISFFSTLADVLIMIMPACGYLDTARIIIGTKNPAACNYIQCLILISSQGLKIFYRIFHPFAARVFGQSVSQFTTAFLLVYLRFHYMNNQPPSQHEKIKQEKMTFPYLFYTTRVKTFFEFLLSFMLYLSIVSFLFYVNYSFVNPKSAIEAIGIAANLVETTIVLPLFYRVVIQRDIVNLSKVLVIQFASGDIMRLVLFVLSNAPVSFIAGVCLQILLDMIMFVNYLQLYFCSKSKHVKQEEEELISNSQFDESVGLDEDQIQDENPNPNDSLYQDDSLEDKNLPAESNI